MVVLVVVGALLHLNLDVGFDSGILGGGGESLQLDAMQFLFVVLEWTGWISVCGDFSG